MEIVKQVRGAAAAMIFAGVAGSAAGEPPRIVNMGVAPGETSSIALAVTPDGSAATGRSGYLGFRWTASAGLEPIGHLPGTGITGGLAITDDGGTVVGYGLHSVGHHGCSTALRWTKAGLENFGAQINQWGEWSHARGVSGDGRVIVGEMGECVVIDYRPFRWTAQNGVQVIGPVPGHWLAKATAVSGDGAVIAGIGGYYPGPTSHDAWRWTEGSGVQILGRLPGNVMGCAALAMSRGGDIIGGECTRYTGGHFRRAFIWTEQGGMTELPGTPTWKYAVVYGISGDGSLVVGMIAPGTGVVNEPSLAAAWIDGALLDLNLWLPTRGVDLAGWVLQEARAVNPAGNVIVGMGLYKGEPRAYIAYLGCYANCDGSTVEPVLNVDDFTCFINEFAAGSALTHEEQVAHRANCDGSTTAPVLDVDDFSCFIDEFVAGCR